MNPYRCFLAFGAFDFIRGSVIVLDNFILSEYIKYQK